MRRPGLKRSSPLPALVASMAIGACVLLGFAARVDAATLTVANCNDSGAGSLRSAVTRAHSGDLLDLRRLRCTIALTSGQLDVPQENLGIVGPGAAALAITSQNRSRIILHAGTGTLRIASLSLVDGTDTALRASGGCIRSAGSVILQDARVHQCTANGVDDPGCGATGACGKSLGGAVYAAGSVRMSNATVSDSRALNYDSFGGGIVANELRMFHSRLLRNSGNFSGGAHVARFIALGSIISGNSASGGGGGGVYAGLVTDSEASGSADVRDSAFTGNRTGYGDCSALCAREARVVNSTFSANIGDYTGAIAVTDGSLVNSTVVRNRARYACNGAVVAGASLYLESTILAGNPCGIAGLTMDLGHAGSLVGAHNLVRVATASLPADTLRSDPLLGPLADNGGPTPTHALLSGSPAIDTGSNPLSLAYDQRGPGFARTKGAGTDIGALER